MGPFKPLKQYWRQEVRNFQKDNFNVQVRRIHVAPLLQNVLKKLKVSSIINGFEATGLFPLNPDRPDYQTKCLEISFENDTEATGNVSQSRISSQATVLNPEINVSAYKSAVAVIEKELGPEKYRSLKNNRDLTVDDFYALYRRIYEAAHPEKNDEAPPNGTPDEPLDITIDVSDELTVVQSLEPEPPNDTPDEPVGIAIDELTTVEAIEPEESLITISVDHSDADCTLPNINKGTSPLPSTLAAASEETTPQPSILPAASGENSPQPSKSKHVFWEGKLSFKKRVEPSKPTPFMISKTNYRQICLNKNESKRNKKKTVDDWVCCYCLILWSTDNSKRTGKKWIECDSCDKKMHVSCNPRSHLKRVGYSESDDEIDFLCETCYKVDD